MKFYNREDGGDGCWGRGHGDGGGLLQFRGRKAFLPVYMENKM